MHFLVIGGSGRTGSEVVNLALSRSECYCNLQCWRQANSRRPGHEVTILVRNPSKIEARPGQHLVKGTPTSLDDMRKAFAGRQVDAVLVTLNAPRASDSPFAQSIAPPRMMADSVQNAANAMKEAGVKRLIVMQAYGVGDSFANLNVVMRLVIG